MDLEKEYSDRQIAILNEIGRENRDRLPKDKVQYIVFFWILHVLLAGAGVALCFINTMFIIFAVLIGILIIYEIVKVYTKKLATFNELINNGTDLEVGIYYAPKSLKVKGNAERKKYYFIKQVRLYGIIAVLVGAFFIYSAASNTNYDAATIAKSYTCDDEGIVYTLDGDITTASSTVCLKVTSDTTNTYYFPYTKYSSAFDWNTYNAFKTAAGTTPLNIKMTCTKGAVSTSSTMGYFFAISIENPTTKAYVDVLPADKIHAIQHNERVLSYSLGGVAAGVGVILLASMPLYIAYVYKKNIVKESIDLTPTEEDTYEVNVKQGKIAPTEYADGEVDAGGNDAASMAAANAQVAAKEKEEADMNTPIRVSALKALYSNIPIYGGMGGILILLIGNMISNNAAKIALMIAGGVIALLGIGAYFFIRTYYSEINGENIITSKLNKKNTIKVSDVKEIEDKGTSFNYLDANKNILFTLDKTAQQVAAFNERLVKLGVGQTEIVDTASNETTSFTNVDNNDVVEVKVNEPKEEVKVDEKPEVKAEEKPVENKEDVVSPVENKETTKPTEENKNGEN